MHFIRFTSAIPLDHLTRGLDELRRIGFDLCAVSVSAPDQVASIKAANAETRADIRIDFRPEGAMAPQTLLDRMSRIPGICDLQGGPALR